MPNILNKDGKCISKRQGDKYETIQKSLRLEEQAKRRQQQRHTKGLLKGEEGLP